MSTVNPIINKEELREHPFRRRPVAAPGTALVFQKRTGELINPRHAITAGDILWRGFQTLYTVDIRPHDVQFNCDVPSQDSALQFKITIEYTWVVADPVQVVSRQVENTARACQTHLISIIRPMARNFRASEEARAEATIMATFRDAPVVKDGIEITVRGALVRSDHIVISGERDKVSQNVQLDLHSARLDFFSNVLRQGGTSVFANMLAADPEKAGEAAKYLVEVWDKDRNVALEAAKALMQSDHVHEGEFDGVVGAVFDRLKEIASGATSPFSPERMAAPIMVEATAGTQGSTQREVPDRETSAARHRAGDEPQEP